MISRGLWYILMRHFTVLSYWLSENAEMASLEAVSNIDRLRYSHFSGLCIHGLS